MDKYELQKLRDLPIEEVAERLELSLSGGRHKALCPFHADHHASLSFHTGRNTFCCFACGAKGGVIDLVMKYLRLDFKEACRWLGDGRSLSPSPSPIGRGVDSIGRGVDSTEKRNQDYKNSSPWARSGEAILRYERFFLRPWLSQEARHFLFDERRLDPRVISWCRLTSWRDRNGIPWLQIPYYDMDGKLIGVQNRNLSLRPPQSPRTGGSTTPENPSSANQNIPPLGGSPPRFRFPYGSQCSIYNLPILKLLKPGDELWITEGCSDCWAMLSTGRKAIAIPSATLLSQKDKELLASLSLSLSLKWRMFPDQDLPGERLFLQLKEILPNLQRHQLPVGCKDFSDYYLLNH